MNYQALVAFYQNRPNLNDMIKRLLMTCPNSSVFGIGGHSVVLQLSTTIAAKVALTAGEESLHVEQRVLRALEGSGCPHVTQHYLFAPDVIFMELLQNNHLHDRLAVDKPRPILRWMLQLSRAAATLESLGYAHGDIDPRNILVDDDDQLKLVDFDNALKIGENVNVGYEPYVRQFSGLHVKGGCYGIAGPASEQFALGSVFWYMTRGSAAYCELEGHERVNILIKEIFPATDPDDPIDHIISNCWNARYATVADLVKDIETLLGDEPQTPNTISVSQREERRLLCEQYCRMADIALDGVGANMEDLSSCFNDASELPATPAVVESNALRKAARVTSREITDKNERSPKIEAVNGYQRQGEIRNRLVTRRVPLQESK